MEISTGQIAGTQDVMEFLTRCPPRKKTVFVVVPSGKKIEIPIPIAERIKAAHLLLKIHGAYQREAKAQVSAVEKFVSALEAADSACAESNTVKIN